MSRATKLTLLSILITLLLALPTFAQSGHTFRLLPDPYTTQSKSRAYFEYETSAGSIIRDTVLITNTGTTALDLVLYAADARTASNGGISIATSLGAAPQANGRWLALENSSVTLPAGEIAAVSFTLTLPDSLPTGEYAAMIVAQEANSAELDSTSLVGTQFIPRAGISVLATVSGEPLQGDLQLNALFSDTDEAQSVTIEMANVGNDGIVRSDGLFSIQDAQGATVFEQPFRIGYFLAGDTLQQRIGIEPALPAADYVATVVMQTDAGREVSKSAELSWSAPEQLPEIHTNAPIAAQPVQAKQSAPSEPIQIIGATIPEQLEETTEQIEHKPAVPITAALIALVVLLMLILIIMFILVRQNRRQQALLNQQQLAIRRQSDL